MLGKWTTTPTGKTPAVDLGELGDDLSVILVQGKNAFGDDIYCYLKLPLKNIQSLQDTLAGNKGFVPSKFGTVLAAGRGEPSDDVRREIGQTEFTVAFKPAELPYALGGKR